MDCTEAYKEHIEYTFNAFCRIVIRYAAINAWRKRDRQVVLVYKCGQEKLNNLYYQVKSKGDV